MGERKGRGEKVERQFVGFIGVGLDGADGEKRLTRADHFILVGGSHETHEKMQDVAVRFDEAVRRTGGTLAETPAEVVIEIFHEVRRTGR